MSTHKHIDKICLAVMAVALVITIIFMNGPALGIEAAISLMGYENKLFDTSYVHKIDIVMEDWDSFISTCENEEYALCDVTIDGETVKNVGIRAKGNTSLSTVASMNSDRYSFKIEFDQYDSTLSYHGLDKLSLNNIIQDNTYMKDYLVYRMMAEFGAAAPLCSYVYITVNDEDWGLYLAAEGVEDSFLQRNYGTDHGELYKPDSMSFGGGRGNGRDFDMGKFEFTENGELTIPETEGTAESDTSLSVMNMGMFGGRGQMPQGEMPEGFDPSQFGNQMPGGQFGGEMPEDFDPSQFGGQFGQMPEGELPEDFSGEMPAMPEGEMPSVEDFGGMKGPGGMGSDDVKLKYIDDDPASYANIFDNAKTDITESDQTRLINSLKALSEGGDVSDVVDIEAVIRYFVVHNFVVNGDSYTGSMVHNYYLYEEDGLLSMIPWDYNLAFGTFQGGSASSSVNDPIDSPVSQGVEDRPMIAWIFGSEEYTELYHEYFSEFVAEFIDNDRLTALIAETAQMIAPYVEKDPTKFCTYEEFEAGVEAVSEFCSLRGESVKGQLKGTVPSTSEGQQADSSALIDVGDLVLSDMGTMNMGGGFDRGQMPGFTGENEIITPSEGAPSDSDTGKHEESTAFGSEGITSPMPGGSDAGFPAPENTPPMR